MQVALVSRYWTKIFTAFLFLSYVLVYPFFVIYPLFDLGIGTYSVSQYGVAYAIFSGPTFWFVIIICNLVSFGHRYVERGYVWLFRPQVPLHPPFPPPPPVLIESLISPLRSCCKHAEFLLPGQAVRVALLATYATAT